MWRYQKPEFQSLLFTELRRQQECSQYCDILLKAKEASVSAHSCVLSAVSHLLSTSLSSVTPLPPGMRQSVEFQDLDAQTLRHMVELLYSGEMSGEGEEERQEALSMAARLGIDGLVEVRRSDWKQRPQRGVDHCTEVTVQTPAIEVELTVQTSASEVEAVVQTSAVEKAVQTSAAQVEAAVQTSVMVVEAAVQTSVMVVEAAVQTESEERKGGCTRWRREARDGVILLWKETASSGGQETWTQTEELPILTAPPPSLPPPPPLHPAASFQTIDIDALQTNSQLVPISIVYNENQWAHTSSAPSSPIEESRQCVGASAPFSLLYSSHVASYGAEPHAGLTTLQTAEETDPEHFEHFQGNIPGFISHFLDPGTGDGSRGRRARRKRAGTTWRRRRGAPRGSGLGGLTQTVDVQEVSAVGRLQTLYLQRLGGRLSRSGQGGGAAGRKLQLKTREVLNSNVAQPKKRVYNKEWQLDQTGDLKLCTSRKGGQRGRRNAAPQVGSSQLSSPPPSPQPPECVYDVTNTGSATLHASPSPAASFLSPAASLLHTCPLPLAAPLPHDEQPEHIDRLLEEVMMGLDILPKSGGTARPPPASSSSSTPTQSQQQSLSTDRRGSSQEVDGAGGGGDVCVLQQVSEGAVNKILDQFLQSYEHFVNAEEKRAAGGSDAEAAPPHAVPSRKPRTQNAGAPPPVRHPLAPNEKSGRTETGGATTAKHGRAKKRPKQYRLSLEKKRVKLKMAVTIHDVNIDVSSRAKKQLQQIPVVKLSRRPFMPVSVSLPDIKDEDSARMEISPAAKNSKDLFPEEYLQLFADRKIYPIRSRLKKTRFIESCSFMDKPLGVLEEPVNADGEPKVDQEPNVQCQKEAARPGRRKKNWRKPSQGEGEDATATKKVCVERPGHDDHVATSESRPATAETPEVGDVNTERRPADGGEEEPRPAEGLTSPRRPVHSKPWASPWRSVPDEDIDVIGGFSPTPEPVTITWTDVSEDEEQEEDVDVVGEK